MEDLKFEISVIFTKYNLNIYSNTNLIQEKYELYYNKLLFKQDLDNVICSIIEEQFDNVIEYPEDYELNFVN